MRAGFFFLLCITTSGVAWSQADLPSNSFESYYQETNPALHYSYEDVKQIHDYSNNWDFDKDGKPDQIYFVGTGGAHLYFFLRVILSSDKRVRNFPFLQSDAPILPPDSALHNPGFNLRNSRTNFAVFDKGKDKCIFIRLDESSFDVEKRILNKKGVKTNLVTITFRNGNGILRDYSYTPLSR